MHTFGHIGPLFWYLGLAPCTWNNFLSKIVTRGTYTNGLVPHLTILPTLNCLNAHIGPHWATFLIPWAGPMCLEQFFVENYDSGHPDECFGASFFQIINLEVPKCKHRAIFLAHMVVTSASWDLIVNYVKSIWQSDIIDMSNLTFYSYLRSCSRSLSSSACTLSSCSRSH